jgi:hypothetical protein
MMHRPAATKTSNRSHYNPSEDMKDSVDSPIEAIKAFQVGSSTGPGTTACLEFESVESSV